MILRPNIRLALACVFFSVMSLTVEAKVFQFNEILNKALTESIDLKIAGIDKQISETALLDVRADYYPQIRSRFTSEYQNDLTDGPSNVVVVGDSILPSGTRFQHSLNFSVTQDIYTFGKRRNKVQAVKSEGRYRSALVEQAKNDLKFTVLELYQEILKNKQNLAFSKQQRELYQEIYDARQRLFDAGEGSKLETTETAISLAQTFSREKRTASKLAELFKSLSYYTREAYMISDEFQNLGDVSWQTLTDIDLNNAPELVAYDHQIEKKASEIKAQKKEWLPVVTGYANYNLFGFDPNQPFRAYGDLGSRSLSVGAYINFPIFDGFRNLAAVKRLKLEAKRLTLEKEKKRRELQKRIDQAVMLVHHREDEAVHRQTVVVRQKSVEAMDQRLAFQGLINTITQLDDQLETLQAELELALTHIDEQGALQQLKFFNGLETHVVASVPNL